MWPGAGADGGVVFAVEGAAGQCRDSIARWPRTREAMAWGLARQTCKLNWVFRMKRGDRIGLISEDTITPIRGLGRSG